MTRKSALPLALLMGALAAAGDGGIAGRAAGDGGSSPIPCGVPDRWCASTHVLEPRCTDGRCTSTCQVGYWNVNLPEAPQEDDGCESSCPAIRGGPPLVRLPDNYCIDSTEVTRGQYQQWVDSEPTTEGQREDCSWNESFGPDRACIDHDPDEDPNDLNHPVVCVDWCDAHAFCSAMGKRLCGRISGGSVPWDDFRDIEISQWHNACVSGPAQYPYNYGLSYIEKSCNGKATGELASLPVASLETCQSPLPGYRGVYDLIGNVWEWEDSCQDDNCRVRGGSHSRTASTCHQPKWYPPDTLNSHLGFRCCSQAQ